MIVALGIIERNAVLIGRFLFRQAQVAILDIVPTWLRILGAAQPPRRTIRCHPRLLLTVVAVHGIGGATTTTVLRTTDINDPMRSTEWTGRVEESLPVTPCCWGEDLRSYGATALVCIPTDVKALCAFHKRTSTIVAFQRHASALA